MRALQDDVTMAEDDLEEATTALKAIPARLPRNEVRPGATRALPRLERRALQWSVACSPTTPSSISRGG